MFGEDQSIEAVFVVDLALHPRSASAAVAIADLGDRQVEVVLGGSSAGLRCLVGESFSR